MEATLQQRREFRERHPGEVAASERLYTKLCAGCGKRKGDQAFPEDLRTKDGLAGTCSTCRFGDRQHAELETVDVPGVDIMAAGVTVHGSGSPPQGDTYTVDELQQLADWSNAVADDLRAPVKIGHNPEQRLLKNSGLASDERPGVGYLKNFRVDGEKLLVDLKDVPRKLADLMKSKAFRLRSAELGPVKHQRSKKTYPQVIKGLALLGATAPAFQTLDDIAALYAGVDREPTAQLIFADETMPDDENVTVVDFAAGDVMWDDEDGFNDIMEDLQRALNPQPPGSDMCNYRYWVRDLALVDVDGDEPNFAPKALVSEYGGPTWMVPLTFTDGEPVPAPPDQWVLVGQAWVELPSDGTANAGDAETPAPSGDGGDNFADATGAATAADTTGHMAGKNNTAERPDLDEKQVAFFAEALGIEGDATPDKIYEAIEAKAKADTDAPVPPPGTPGPTEGTPGDGGPSAPAPPAGVRQMSEDEYTELRAMAQQGSDLAEKMRVRERDTFLRDAIKEGRLDPADLKLYQDKYDQDSDFVRTFVERLPQQDQLLRVYGADYDVFGSPDMADERFFAEACAATGVPYVPHPSLAAQS